jgi:hypothetical protein
MKIVIWCNDRNMVQANNGDGYGSKSHLSIKNPNTLCGKIFPAYKGFPSSTGFCKKCLSIAYKKGYPKGFTKSLEEVPSIGTYGED